MPTTRFVLVGDDQVPVSPQDAVSRVQKDGFKGASLYYGVSESTLRKFVKANGYTAHKTVRYEKLVEVPGGVA